MDVRPFALLASSALAAIGPAVDAAMRAWCAEWGIERTAVEVECRRAWEAEVPAAAVWRPVATASGHGHAWSALDDGLPDAIRNVLFASEQRYPVATRHADASMASMTAQAALDALLTHIATVFSTSDAETGAMTPSQPPTATWRRGSGAAVVSMRVGNSACRIVADHVAVSALAPVHTRTIHPDKPVNRNAMLGRLPVALSVQAGSAEVDMGHLATLRVGDVIRLDTLVDQLLSVVNPEGRHVFAGYLHTAGSNVVIEVARPGR